MERQSGQVISDLDKRMLSTDGEDLKDEIFHRVDSLPNIMTCRSLITTNCSSFAEEMEEDRRRIPLPPNPLLKGLTPPCLPNRKRASVFSDELLSATQRVSSMFLDKVALLSKNSFSTR